MLNKIPFRAKLRLNNKHKSETKAKLVFCLKRSSLKLKLRHNKVINFRIRINELLKKESKTEFLSPGWSVLRRRTRSIVIEGAEARAEDPFGESFRDAKPRSRNLNREVGSASHWGNRRMSEEARCIRHCLNKGIEERKKLCCLYCDYRDWEEGKNFEIVY